MPSTDRAFAGSFLARGAREVDPTSGRDGIDRARFRGALAVVLLPTLNEERGLARTLRDLPLDRFDRPGQRIQPLIIDGGSTDGTLEVAREWDVPVLKQTSRGKGGAMLEAIAWIHQRGIPFVVVLDADATYPPDRILPALDLLQAGTDLVIGVRHPVWGPPSDLKDLVHRVGNLVMSYTASLLTRRPILDLCSGFWGVSTTRFMELGLDDSSFAIEAELVLKSVRRGFSIHQITVDYHERLGQAKLRALRDGSRIFHTILREARTGPHPGQTGSTPAPWARDVLSIGLSLGISGALLECAPSDAVEADHVARYLQRNLPGTRVRVAASAPSSSLSPNPPALSPSLNVDTAETSPSPLTVSLPPISTIVGGTRSATVSIRSNSRQFRIELPSSPAQVVDGPVASTWARAGGWRTSGWSLRALSPSLLVLTSRLNFQREHQQATLLSANGFHVVEHRGDLVRAPRLPPLEGFLPAT